MSEPAVAVAVAEPVLPVATPVAMPKPQPRPGSGPARDPNTGTRAYVGDKIIMHWLVEVPKAPAKHMISGGMPDEPAFRSFVEATKNPVGASAGRHFAPACDHSLVIGTIHRGSGEACALLTVLNGEQITNEIACPKCVAMAEWRDAVLKNPHPKWRAELDPTFFEGDAPGCCG